MVLSLSILAKLLKLGKIDPIFPKKHALLIWNVSQFMRKCTSSPVSPEDQILQILDDGGIAGLEYLNFSISKLRAEHRNRVKNERWFRD